jgi:hypothetical protein
MCALNEGLCITCGESRLDSLPVTDRQIEKKAAGKKADRQRRRRELQLANVEREAMKPIRNVARRRSRKECGKHPPQRQRHRKPMLH